MDIFKIYKKLKKHYGPQGWWPIFIPKKHKDRLAYHIPFDELHNYRTNFRDPMFEIAVGTILTQSTAWKNVSKAIINLYNAKALTPKSIVKLKYQTLEKIIRPSGYFRQKRKKLLAFSKWLVQEYGGDISKLKTINPNELRLLLLNQWGIGKETADSIMLYALNMPVFMIDEYTRRLCKKCGLGYEKYDEFKQYFEEKLAKKKHIYNELHALIVASGQEKHSSLV